MSSHNNRSGRDAGSSSRNDSSKKQTSQNDKSESNRVTAAFFKGSKNNSKNSIMPSASKFRDNSNSGGVSGMGTDTHSMNTMASASRFRDNSIPGGALATGARPKPCTSKSCNHNIPIATLARGANAVPHTSRSHSNSDSHPMSIQAAVDLYKYHIDNNIPLPNSAMSSSLLLGASKFRDSSSHPQTTAHTKTEDLPPRIKTAYTKPEDIQRASKQMDIDKLQGQERKDQEDWAQKKILEMSACPAGYSWRRVDHVMPSMVREKFRGYWCRGGTHWITDDMLAEGRGAYLIDNFPLALLATPSPYFRGLVDTKIWIHCLNRDLRVLNGLNV